MGKVKLCEGLKNKYIIPCFQREYSWGEEEIEELIKNILNTKNDENYCLGIITVKVNKNNKMLIDGQQRLTTLYMIAIYCGYIEKVEEINLESEYDLILNEQSNNLKKIFSMTSNDNEFDKLPPNLKIAWKIIKNKISDADKEKIKEKIKNNLYYYEINLDDKVNINHYFEVMNSRGIQLSRSDIIKSFLMNRLDDDIDKSRLNYLWYNLEKMNNTLDDIKSFKEVNKKNNVKYLTINNIISQKNNFNTSYQIEQNNKDYDNSILNFEYFLLYSIRIYKNKDKKNYDSSGEFNLEDLIKEYKDEFIHKNSEEIIEYLNFLISIKKIYDKYIVKYDKIKDTWQLDINNEKIKLIQSCLRVSFINRRLMHWIYITLKYVYNNKDINEYVNFMEKYIKEKYIKNFINDNKDNNYRTGFDTPVIVLNYLDYLMKINYKKVIESIPESKDIEFEKFTFKFRNSIEHFMPRTDENGEPNEDWVDNFGNLALLAYGTNTKMQNANPLEKATHFKYNLSGYSIKLQIMTKIALDGGWNKDKSTKLTRKCINLLDEDLKLK